MSHNITLSGVKFTDTQLLSEVVKSLSNGEAVLDLNAKSFRTYPGQPTDCDACIKMPGAHDIGLKRQSDGSFIPVYDPYRMSDIFTVSGVEGYASNRHISGLQMEYGLRQAEYEAAQSGFSTERVQGPKGVVTLELTAN